MTTTSLHTGPGAFRQRVLIVLLLSALIWAVFGQTLRHDFVSLDDSGYVYQNDLIKRGLTAKGLKAAFTQTHARNWHPLTTVSHMLDCQLYGLEPGGHHLTNLLLHLAAALLLFQVFAAMTNSIWPSALVAALFAIHPLRAESVAWIAERKDVLSALLFMIATGAYVRYARKPLPASYALTCLALALGLMAKSMLVTLPLLFLLLDYWPLRRLDNASAAQLWRVILEKLPFFVLAGAAATATFLAQKTTVAYCSAVPFTWRLGNSLSVVFIYVGQMFWPRRLAVFYPYPATPPHFWQLGLLLLAILGLTVCVFLLRRQRPWLLIGWLWYLIALLPVIGLVQVGLQGHADRYTYLPQIGLGLIVAWEAAALARSHRAFHTATPALACAVIILLTGLGWQQVATWKNTETLWRHAVAVAPTNVLARYSLAGVCLGKGETDDAIFHYREALRFASFKAVEVGQPHVAYLHNSLGNALIRKGRVAEAAQQYRLSVSFKSDFADAHLNLGHTLIMQNRLDEAANEFELARGIPPEDAESHLGLGTVFRRKGEDDAAIAHFQRAITLSPASPKALDGLADVLVNARTEELRNPRRGLELAEQAIRLTGNKDGAAKRIAAAARFQLGLQVGSPGRPAFATGPAAP